PHRVGGFWVLDPRLLLHDHVASTPVLARNSIRGQALGRSTSHAANNRLVMLTTVKIQSA
ncbi:MAG: hypothetical protein O2839_04865, partial [Cyanobacteria bacterium]|nr:hypothetical protein [Cyanobacteriota bacterium]